MNTPHDVQTRVDDDVESASTHAAAAMRERHEIGMTDQADGLRSMFAGSEPQLYCLASALPPDATVTLGLGTAYALRQRGHLTLLVDEVPLFERQTSKGFAFPVRFDLGQVFSGSVDLNRVLRKVSDKLWFASGVKVAAAVAAKRTRSLTLMDMLQRSGLDFEFVIIASCEPFGSNMPCYGSDVKRIVVAAPNDESLSRALSHLRELSVLVGGEAVPVLIAGGSESEGRQAYERLAQQSQQLLEQPLQSLGWVPTASATRFGTSNDGDLVLPITLYRSLVGHMTTCG
jgi:hypothetical protein